MWYKQDSYRLDQVKSSSESRSDPVDLPRGSEMYKEYRFDIATKSSFADKTHSDTPRV